jgi:alpha-D-xyloside xylohydrolase
MLTVGDRTGSFPGMQQQRTFRIVVVQPGHGTGIEPASEPDRSILYDGKLQKVHFETR